jgi:hypothetical protein
VEIAKIRGEHSKESLEFNKIVEARKQAEQDWQHSTKDKAAWDKYQLEDKKLAQQQYDSASKIQHWQDQHDEKVWEWNNPQLSKPPQDRVTITNPDGTTSVLHRGQPAFDAWEKKQKNAEETKKQKAAAPNWWQRNVPGAKQPEPYVSPPETTPDQTSPRTNGREAPPPLRPSIAPPPIQRAPYTSPASPVIPSQPVAPVPQLIAPPATQAPNADGQAPSYMVPPPNQTATAAPEAVAPATGTNFLSKLANVMHPPDATPPGGIAQMLFQGIGKAIQNAQAKKAARNEAMQQSQMIPPPMTESGNSIPSPVGPQMTAPPLAAQESPQTDDWMGASGVAQAPTAIVSPKRPSRAIARDYVNKFGAKAADQLKADGFDIGGYAD